MKPVDERIPSAAFLWLCTAGGLSEEAQGYLAQMYQNRQFYE
jgi:hypothetical protein